MGDTWHWDIDLLNIINGHSLDTYQNSKVMTCWWAAGWRAAFKSWENMD